MNLLLLHQDPGLHSSTRWIAKGMVASILLVQLFLAWQGFLAKVGSDTVVFAHPSLALAIWIPVSIYLLSPGSRKRCSDLALALPIESRQLWRTHLAAVLFSGASVILIAAGIIEIHRWMLVRMAEHLAPTTGDILALALRSFVGLTVAVVLLQSRNPGDQSIPADRTNVLRSLGILVGSLGLVVVLGFLPAYFAVVPLAVAWWLGARVYRSLPESFAVPTEQNGDISRGDAAAWGSTLQTTPRKGLRYSLLQIRTILLCYSTKDYGIYMALFIAYPILIAGGLLFSGIWPAYELMRYSWVALTAYLFFSFVPGFASRLFLLDALPISRRVIFATLVLPCVLSMALGYGLGILIQTRQQPELVQYVIKDPFYYVQVPTRYLQITEGSELPVVQAPWGEAHTAFGGPVIRGSKRLVYSPFSVSEASSPEFEAMLLSRAAKAVYGVEIPHTELMERYFTIDASGSISLSQEEITLRRDYGGPEPRVSLPLFPVVTAAVILLWALAASLYFQTFRAGVSTRLRRTAFVVIAIALLVLHLGPFPLFVADVTEPWKLSAGLEVPLRQAANALPGGAVLIWIMGALVAAAAYRLAEWRFERAEIPIDRG